LPVAQGVGKRRLRSLHLVGGGFLAGSREGQRQHGRDRQPRTYEGPPTRPERHYRQLERIRHLKSHSARN
jgi:hypothetical protein